ncbi:MAG TPA: hypothetical protein VGW40_03355 [Allosphingosinicella sp.]|nr:hypothetical protein [Allosphingosinicella sp.]
MEIDPAPSVPPEETRQFLRATVLKLPGMVGSFMLRDTAALNRMGLPVGDFVSVLGQRFDRARLLAALRDVANGKDAGLASEDGEVQIDRSSLDEDGVATLMSGDKGAAFANIGLLSDDAMLRRHVLDRIVAKGEMSEEREGMWRAAIEMGSLDDDLFVALETESGASPEAHFREIGSEIASLNASFNVLVPVESDYYAALLGQWPIPATFSEFRIKWLQAAAGLNPARLLRLLKLSAPVSMASGRMIGVASDHLPAEDRIVLVEFLQSCSDPFSLVAAFEVACRHRTDPGMRDLADTIIARLYDRNESTIDSGGADFGAMAAITSALAARHRLLADWPLYARRLARLLHASHLVRILGSCAVERPALYALVNRTIAPQARLAELCDAREAPIWQQHYLGPALIHGLAVRRASEAVAMIKKRERPKRWVKLDASVIEQDMEDGWALFFFAAGPLDEFDEDWTGLPLIPAENLEPLHALLREGKDSERIAEEIYKLAIAFEVDPADRQPLIEGLPLFLRRFTGADFALCAEVGLQIAARWRNVAMADAIIEVVFDRFRNGPFEDLGTVPRFFMAGAASVEGKEEWLERAGSLAHPFAFTHGDGPAAGNLVRAFDILGEFDPALGAALARAKSFALLAYGRLPKVEAAKSGAPEDAADQNAQV